MFILCLLLPAFAEATYSITVYGDVLRDTTFFTQTYPWIIDNIGGDISVDYYLLGSGRYSVPQMCALAQLKMNTFLQAQFLKCEAEGTQTEICLCNSGIEPQRFRQCVSEKGNKAGIAASKYSQLNLDSSPIIELWPKNTVSDVSDTGYLKKICTIFGDEDRPRGCIKPFDCKGTEAFPERRAVAFFDCNRDYCEGYYHSTHPYYTEPEPTGNHWHTDPTSTTEYYTTTFETTTTPRPWAIQRKSNKTP